MEGQLKDEESSSKDVRQPFEGEVLQAKPEELFTKRLVGFAEKLDTLPENVGTGMVSNHLQSIR